MIHTLKHNNIPFSGKSKISYSKNDNCFATKHYIIRNINIREIITYSNIS
jgi:hypothetical protein